MVAASGHVRLLIASLIISALMVVFRPSSPTPAQGVFNSLLTTRDFYPVRARYEQNNGPCRPNPNPHPNQVRAAGLDGRLIHGPHGLVIAPG